VLGGGSGPGSWSATTTDLRRSLAGRECLSQGSSVLPVRMRAAFASVRERVSRNERCWCGARATEVHHLYSPRSPSTLTTPSIGASDEAVVVCAVPSRPTRLRRRHSATSRPSSVTSPTGPTTFTSSDSSSSSRPTSSAFTGPLAGVKVKQLAGRRCHAGGLRAGPLLAYLDRIGRLQGWARDHLIYSPTHLYSRA